MTILHVRRMMVSKYLKILGFKNMFPSNVSNIAACVHEYKHQDYI